MKLPYVFAAIVASTAAANPMAMAIQLPFVINEANAVADAMYIEEGPYSGVPVVERLYKQDTYFATIPELAVPAGSPQGVAEGTPDGRIQGNGGDWIELVITSDRTSIAGWSIEWSELYLAANSTDGLDGRRGGRITFSDDPVWTNLRAGTVVTISQAKSVWIDTDFTGNNRNLTEGVNSENGGDYKLDLSTDLSFNPVMEDWWMHVSTKDEADKENPLITTIDLPGNYKYAEGDAFAPGDFSVTNDDWAASILDPSETVVFGPMSELISLDTQALFGGANVNSREMIKLQANPSSDSDYYVNQGHYSDGSTSTFGRENVWSSGTGSQDFTDLRSWFTGVLEGDYNGDGEVNLADYTVWRDQLGATGTGLTADGDASGTVDDGDYAFWKERFGTSFNSGSLAGVGQSTAVPEPTTLAALLVGSIAALVVRRSQR